MVRCLSRKMATWTKQKPIRFYFPVNEGGDRDFKPKAARSSRDAVPTEFWKTSIYNADRKIAAEVPTRWLAIDLETASFA